MAPAPNGRSQLSLRWAVIGAASAGALGAVIGLVIGLLTYPRTAWFAVFEVGIPATVVGCLVGLAVGAIVEIFRRRRLQAGRRPVTPDEGDW